MASTSMEKVAKGGANGFISRISEGWTSGLTSIGKDVLPVWAANQLGIQSKDQTSQPVYDRGGVNSQPRQDNLLGYSGSGNTGIAGGINIGGAKISTPVMIVGGLMIGAVVFMVVRR